MVVSRNRLCGKDYYHVFYHIVSAAEADTVVRRDHDDDSGFAQGESEPTS
jgi:hypothetical protein